MVIQILQLYPCRHYLSSYDPTKISAKRKINIAYKNEILVYYLNRV